MTKGALIKLLASYSDYPDDMTIVVAISDWQYADIHDVDVQQLSRERRNAGVFPDRYYVGPDNKEMIVIR